MFMTWWYLVYQLFVLYQNGYLVYHEGTIHIGYWNHCSSVFQFRWYVYVEKQGKSHQLMAQLISYHWRISEKEKGQELTLEAYHRRFYRCLNIYFQCLLRMPDQSNMNKTSWQYRQKKTKKKKQLTLIFLTLYYDR